MYMLLIDGELKPGKQKDFLAAWNSHILPLLKKQNGFVDEILLFEHGAKNTATGLCFWKSREDGERYHRDAFAQAKGAVQHLINGAPTIRGFDVAAAETFHIVGKAA
jgi:hypothetical protein